MAVDDGSYDEITIDKLPAHKMTVDETSIHKMALDKMSVTEIPVK